MRGLPTKKLLYNSLLLFLLITGVSKNIWAQSRVTVDNIYQELTALPDDTIKVSRLLDAARQYRQYFRQKDTDNIFLEEALNLAQRLNDLHRLAEAYDLMSVRRRDNSQYLLAVDYGQLALAAAKKLNDSALLADIYNNIGVAYRRLDENQLAFENHLTALKISEAIGDLRNKAVATNSIGNIELSLGNYHKAIDEFQQSLAIEKERKNDLGIAINYGNIGVAYQGLKQVNAAIDYILISLRYNEQINSTNGILICCNSLGQLYQQQGKYQLALQYFLRALSVSDKIGDKIDVADSYISIGKLYARQKKYKDAFTNIQHGLAIATQIKSKSMSMAAYQALEQLYRDQGDYEKSLDMLQKSLNYKDSIINEKSSTRLAELQVMYDMDKKDNEIKLLQQQNRIRELQSNRNWSLALALLIFVVLLITGGLLYIRQKNLQSHKAALQLELQSLRGRMNPHFIFNSLNSIHKYIWSNQAEEASEYLTKFSRLIRMILENSQQSTISLSKELQFLSLYLELERLRCNNKFSYSINVAPDIDQDDIMVPSLMIQPFVENAIWHGLVHKDSNGMLNINVRLQDNKLICEVEDDGIGRKKAMEIRQRKQPAHQSMGMKLTEDRIKLMQEVTGNAEASITIIDLQDKEGHASGTKVVIELPAEFLF